MKSKRFQFLATLARWGWFGLLVLIAFGFLASGLSNPQPDKQPVSFASSTDSIAATIEKVDLAREAALRRAGLFAAEPADWLTICRRLSLAMVGNQLSLEEIRNLERLPQHQREAAHLASLLDQSRFHHYWGERWTRFLVGTDFGDLVTFRRRRFRVWLAEVFADPRMSYDRMVRELVTAEGLWTDRPEVNFLTATLDSNEGQPDPVRLAARTSRAFLSLRIDCLQCHDDFLGNVSLGDAKQPREGLESDFHALAAFYSGARTSGLQGVRSGQANYRYQFLHADEEVRVEPAVPYSPELLPAKGDPRHRLAAWITHPENRQAARAAVSHFWALMFGRPLNDAVDNLPLGEEVHPMLDVLADDFIAHDFNMRRLIRVIASSAAFRVDSRADFEITPSHEQLFAVFPLVRLRPEQVAGSVIQASRLKKTDRESSLLLQLEALIGTGQFVEQYGDMGEDEFTTDAVTVTQRLLMMNGDMLKEMIEFNPVLNAPSHIAMFAADDQQAVEVLYLNALNRDPTATESEHFVSRIESAENRNQALEDIAWVLLNSSELAWNH